MATIRAPRPDELPRLIEIEVSAGALFRTVGMDAIADDDPGSTTELADYLEQGLAWVATVENVPAAYLVAETVDGNLHIEQVSVHTDYAHRGLGRALIDRADRETLGRGLPALTLTTYADVPWNGPYYRRCGFRDLPDPGPGLVAIRARETAHGLDRFGPRICMIRPTGGAA